MKKELYHIDFSSHGEVLFRCPEDVGAFINRLALRAYAHDTGILADTEMSDHFHGIIESRDPALFVSSLRSSYTRYLNRKYGRRGRLGEIGFFCRKLFGPVQTVTSISYTLRNGQHHGVTATPFGYPYSSVNEMFAKERGVGQNPGKPISRHDALALFPRHSVIPEHYQTDENGTILRRCFMEIARAESFFVTPRNFLFQMNRISDERWVDEQRKLDFEHDPIRLEDMEPSFGRESLTELLSNEKGWKYNPARLTDFDVCALIDKQLGRRFAKQSVYQLTETQKQTLATELRRKHHLPDSQICRCLVLKQ